MLEMIKNFRNIILGRSTLRLITYKGKEYWVDVHYNRWEKERYTKQEAEEYSKEMTRCFSCLNCSNCVECKHCIDCTDCFGLTYKEGINAKNNHCSK